MTHNARTQLDATWTTGNYVTLIGDWQDLNRKVFASINGDKGGCWSPAATITLTGSLAGHLQVTGPMLVAYGGSLTSINSARFKILGASAWPLLASGHVGRSRDIMHSMFGFQTKDRLFWKHVMGLSTAGSTVSGIQAPFCSYQAPGGLLYAPSFYIPLRVHDGARITSATLRFRVSFARSKKPVVMPKVRIIRVSPDGTIVSLKSVASGADAQGYASPTLPTSGDAWYNGGVAQGFTYVCDQNNIVDASQYLYYTQFIEETGAITALPPSAIDGLAIVERKYDVRLCSTANIALTGNPSPDGAAAVAGDRILCTAQTIPQQNGIWIAAAGAWSRAGDLADASNFTPNFIVGVNGGAAPGTSNNNTLWQITEPMAPQNAVCSSDNSGSPIKFLRVGRAPTFTFPTNNVSSTLRGNIYHSLRLSMDSIVDMRPQ